MKVCACLKRHLADLNCDSDACFCFVLRVAGWIDGWLAQLDDDDGMEQKNERKIHCHYSFVMRTEELAFIYVMS